MYHILGCALVQLPNSLLSIYNQMKKADRVQGEKENHESTIPGMNNETALFSKTYTARVEELERGFKELQKWKDTTLPEHQK